LLEDKYKDKKNIIFIGVHSGKFENEKLSDNIKNSIDKYEIEHPVINYFNN
jgi:hypothetical protein